MTRGVLGGKTGGSRGVYSSARSSVRLKPHKLARGRGAGIELKAEHRAIYAHGTSRSRASR